MRKGQRVQVGDAVYVNKDIYRLEEQYEVDKRTTDMVRPNPTTLDEYYDVDWNIWHQQRKLYAKENEQGIVTEVFSDHQGNWKKRIRYFCKVNIDGKIKTFRTSSVDKV